MDIEKALIIVLFVAVCFQTYALIRLRHAWSLLWGDLLELQEERCLLRIQLDEALTTIRALNTPAPKGRPADNRSWQEIREDEKNSRRRKSLDDLALGHPRHTEWRSQDAAAGEVRRKKLDNEDGEGQL